MTALALGLLPADETERGRAKAARHAWLGETSGCSAVYMTALALGLLPPNET